MDAWLRRLNSSGPTSTSQSASSSRSSTAARSGYGARYSAPKKSASRPTSYYTSGYSSRPTPKAPARRPVSRPTSYYTGASRGSSGPSYTGGQRSTYKAPAPKPVSRPTSYYTGASRGSSGPSYTGGQRSTYKAPAPRLASRPTSYYTSGYSSRSTYQAPAPRLASRPTSYYTGASRVYSGPSYSSGQRSSYAAPPLRPTSHYRGVVRPRITATNKTVINTRDYTGKTTFAGSPGLSAARALGGASNGLVGMNPELVERLATALKGTRNTFGNVNSLLRSAGFLSGLVTGMEPNVDTLAEMGFDAGLVLSRGARALLGHNVNPGISGFAGGRLTSPGDPLIRRFGSQGHPTATSPTGTRTSGRRLARMRADGSAPDGSTYEAADRALLGRTGSGTATGRTTTGRSTGTGADRALLNRDPLGVAGPAAELRRLSALAEQGAISDNDPRIDEASRALRKQISRQVAPGDVAAVMHSVIGGATGQQAIRRVNPPSRTASSPYGDPHLMSDAQLHAAIMNWPGTDNDPLLDGLVRERNSRTTPEGGWDGLGQARVTWEVFGARGNGQTAALNTDDAIGVELAAHLEAEGFEPEHAEEIAAGIRTRFPGIEIRDYEGFAHAIRTGWTINEDANAAGRDPSPEDFFDLAAEYGIDTVTGLNSDLYNSGREAIAVYADMEGVRVTDQMVADIFAYAQLHGTETAYAAQIYFGLDLMELPPDVDGTKITDPLVAEQGLIIDLETRTIDAMNGLSGLVKEYENSNWRLATNDWISLSPSEREWRGIDTNGDGISEAPPGVGDMSREAFDSLDAILRDAAVELQETAPTQQAVQQQVNYVTALRFVQNNASLIGHGVEVDPNTPAQTATLTLLSAHQDEIVGLLSPEYDADLDLWILPTMLTDQTAGIDTYDGTDYFSTNQQVSISGEVSLSEIERILAIYDSQQTAPPGVDRIISPGLARAFRALLADPELIAAIAPRDTDDTFSEPTTLHAVDLVHNPGQAIDRDFVATVLAPYQDEIDAIKNGQTPDGERNRSDYEKFVQDLSDDPTVPKLVIEAAELALSKGYTDERFIDQLHVALDVIGALPIPIVSELADLTNAGLYAVVDRDAVNAGISLAGLAPVAGSVIVAARYTDEAIDLARALDNGDITTVFGATMKNTSGVPVAVRFDDGYVRIVAPGERFVDFRVLQDPTPVLRGAPNMVPNTTLRADGLTTDQASYFRRQIDNATSAQAADAARYARYMTSRNNLGKVVKSQDEWLILRSQAEANRVAGKANEAMGRNAVSEYTGIDLVDNDVGDIVRYTDEAGTPTRPDSVSPEIVHEHKNLAGQKTVVYNTAQIRAQRELAVAEGQDMIVSISRENADLANGIPRPSSNLKPNDLLDEQLEVLFVDPVTGSVTHEWDFLNRVWVSV